MNRLRWLILILGPVPIVCLSWAVSAWFKSDALAVAAHNSAFAETPGDTASVATAAHRPFNSRDEDTELARACDQMAERAVKQLGPECQVIARAPFVLAGDLTVEQLEAWHTGTIVPAVRAMELRYFPSRPDQPITVLLFRGEESYNRFAQSLFGDSGVSIYGYYKPNVRTLLVNTATGGGTLMHELTHALLDFDMPDAPAWLNEGLASLHEQCRFRSDQRGPWIEGLVNWRLPSLQATIREGRLRPLLTMIESDDFRGPLVGTNYAQARYFCLYMQHKGVLEDYLRHFREHRATDALGAASVAHIFGEAGSATLDRDFQRWVLELSQ